MAASAYYSHSELMGKNGSDKQEMLFQKGVNWNDYPTFFKRGTYVQRKRVVTPFTSEEIEKLPAKHNARKDPNVVIERWVVDTVELPRLSSIENSVGVIVFGEEPKLKSPVI
jgi:tRNA(His) 5'-end guanylyltransferase